MEAMIARFGAMHPDLEIETTIIDREAYKTQIRNFLTANAPDVATWYAANRMRPYVAAGLFEDVSDLWQEPEIAQNLASTKGALTIDGKQWGVPYTYYQWGVYYREDIFDELGLSEPVTWEEEKANCAKIVASGRACYTIGTKFLWTAGGWFDYLNLRTNGYDFHMALTQGEVAWTDERVRAVFANWRELIDISLYKWDGLGEARYIGLQNYYKLLDDRAFETSLWNNLKWLILYLAAVPAGLLIAIFLNQTVAGIRLYKSLFFFPFVISQVVVGLVFTWFYDPTFGLLNTILGRLGAGPLNVLGDPALVTYGIIAAGLWPQTAYCMILYLTGLNAVDPELVEAGRLDGARGWRMLWHVILPVAMFFLMQRHFIAGLTLGAVK